MKIKILISTILITLTTFVVNAQTYNLDIDGRLVPDGTTYGTGTSTIRRDGALIYSHTNTTPGDVQFIETITSSLFSTMRLETIYSPAIPFCAPSPTYVDYTVDQMILPGSNGFNYCGSFFSVEAFPNITINRLPPGGSSTLCSGEQLSLTATSGFPTVAYNWQYKTTTGGWTDFPAAFNSTVSVSATMQELIGSTHLDFVETDISFRVGYTLKGTFSNIIIANYSACAPLVTSIDYNPPNCTGDPVSVVVNLDRPLETGETFSQIEIINAADGTQILAQATDVSTDTSGGTTFTFSNVNGLEEGVTYRIRYQMKKNGVLASGFIESVQTFIFNDATPVTFTAGWTDVDCFGENTGSISITAGGGAGSYEYSINNGTNWSPFSGATTHTVINLVSGDYQVKVRDANNCIAQQ